jgi:hypothetical protein
MLPSLGSFSVDYGINSLVDLPAMLASLKNGRRMSQRIYPLNPLLCTVCHREFTPHPPLLMSLKGPYEWRLPLKRTL